MRYLALACDYDGTLARARPGSGLDDSGDHAFLELCGCAVAVANALPMMKEKADFVTQGEGGDG